MKVDTIKGSSYVVTCTKACTVRAVLNSGGDSMLILETGEKGQYGFAAPTDAVEVSDDDALITRVSKTAVPGLSVRDGIQPGTDAALKSLTAESGTFTGAVNVNGGVNIPLTAGAPTDTSALNRLYAAGLAFAAESFSLPSYPVKSSCSATGGASFDDTLAPLSLGLRVPVQTAVSAMIGFADAGKSFNNYSGTRGFVLPVSLPQVPFKVTLPVYKVPVVFRENLELDSFTLVPSASSLFFGEILDITFNPERDADAGGYHVRVREVYWSNQAAGMKVKTTHSLVKAASNQRLPLCVAKIVYEQWRDGQIDTEERGALWLVHFGSTESPCIKIATVRGAHCFESNSLGKVYLDIASSATVHQIRIGTLSQHVGLSGLNPAYYGFSAMETNAIVSETVEDFVDPEA